MEWDRETEGELGGILDFVRRAEQLKSTLRSCWMRDGRRESTAEHSWRLALLALLVAGRMPDLDVRRVVELCLVHDLGEAVHGDIPAPEQVPGMDKADMERVDLLDLLRPLPARERDRLYALWEEYEDAATPEAVLVKGLDKLETLLQQTQGANPPDFDYAFNLSYGRSHTARNTLLHTLREHIDTETEACILARASQTNNM